MTRSAPQDVMSTLAHHDAAIENLGGRMSGVESGLRTLQGEVSHGFATITQNINTQIGALSSKFDRLDGRPQFNFHETVKTVVSLAILFSMVVGMIIYVTHAQNAAVVAEQKTLNEHRSKEIEEITERVRDLEVWRPVVVKQK